MSGWGTGFPGVPRKPADATPVGAGQADADTASSDEDGMTAAESDSL